MSAVYEVIEGFWTYQTPVSFLAGVGAYHLYCRMTHQGAFEDEDDDVQETR